MKVLNAVFTVMAAVYFMCALSEMRDSGWEWFQGGNIEQKLVRDALEPIFLDYKWKATFGWSNITRPISSSRSLQHLDC
jgi:hypothetical protein